MKNLSKLEKVLIGLAVVIFAVSFGPRFFDIEAFLPYYSTDENDVVEWAVGFMGGDLEPHWYKYGAFYPYLLAIIYTVQSWFYEGSFEEFVQQIFFDPKSFYYTARFLNAVLSVGLAAITFVIGKRFLSNRIALLTLVLASFPFFDVLINFTLRIDTLLAVFGVLAVFLALLYHQSGKLIYYVLGGLMVGFGIATKPLPGLLVLPTMAIAHFFRHQSALKESGKKHDIIAVIGGFITDKNIYILLVSAFIANFIGNPYSILNYSGFMAEQVAAIGSEGERSYVKGYDITRFFKNFGYVFVIITCISFIHSLINNRTSKHLILMSYPIIFWLAFAKGAAREYFYVPIVPILMLMIAQFIDDIIEKNKDKEVLSIVIGVGLVGVILFQPMKNMFERTTELNSKTNYNEVHTALSANDWILENLPKDSKIMFYGYYTNLPHLIDKNPDEQMYYGEYFMYNRIENEFLKEQFKKAHQSKINSDAKTYDLITQLNFNYKNQPVRWNLRYGVNKNEINLFQEILPQVGCDYLVANGYDRKSKTYNLIDSPFFQKKVFKEFTNKDFPFGHEVTIYKLR